MQAESNASRECPVCYNNYSTQGGAEVLHNPTGRDSDYHKICRECALRLIQPLAGNQFRCPICRIDVDANLLSQSLRNAIGIVQRTGLSANPAPTPANNRMAELAGAFGQLNDVMAEIADLQRLVQGSGNPQPNSTAATYRRPNTAQALNTAVHANAHLDRIGELRRSGRTATDPAANAQLTQMLGDLVGMTDSLTSQLRNLRST